MIDLHQGDALTVLRQIDREAGKDWNNTLTLFSGGQVTDTVKVVNDPVGFGVFRASGGTVVGSGATPVAPNLVPLPGHM